MRRRLYFLFAILLIFSLALAACGGDDDKEPADSGDDTVEQAEEQSVETAEDEAGDSTEESGDEMAMDAVEVNQEYTTEDGLYTVKHPEGWVILDNPPGMFIYSEDAVGSKLLSGFTFDPGMAGVQINTTPNSGGAAGTPSEHVAWATSGLASGYGITFGDAVETEFNGLPSASLNGTSDRFDVMHVATLYEESNLWVGATFYAAPGELDQWEAVFMEMAENLTYNAPSE